MNDNVLAENGFHGYVKENLALLWCLIVGNQVFLIAATWLANKILLNGGEIRCGGNKKEIVDDVDGSEEDVVLEIRDTSHSYKNQRDREVLKNINIKIKKYQFFGILGNNGSGKSTIMKLMTGLEWQKRGCTLVMGRKLANHLVESRDIIRYVQQDDFLFNELTVHQHMLLSC